MNNNYDPTSVPQPMDGSVTGEGNIPVVPNGQNIPAPAPVQSDVSFQQPVLPTQPTVPVTPVVQETPVVPTAPVTPVTPVVNAVPSEPAVTIPGVAPVQGMVPNSTPAVQIPGTSGVNNINQNIDARQENELKNDLLLLAFIGKNCEKITTRSFNIAGFFFSWFYLFYRKMFGYAILMFLANLLLVSLLDISALSIVFNIIVGICVNKMYISFAKKKIDKIRYQNTDKDLEQLKYICAKKGGTSVGYIFLGFIVEILIALVVSIIMILIGFNSLISDYIDLNKYIKIQTNTNGNTPKNLTGTKVPMENAVISGSMCTGENCSVAIQEGAGFTYYPISSDKQEVIVNLGHFSDYVDATLYYIESGGQKYIVDAKIINKLTNEDISDVKTETDLRIKLGLYALGTYTEKMTLVEQGYPGAGYDENGGYTYIPLKFKNDKQVIIEMDYKNPDSSLKLTNNKQYNVEFEVTEGTFDYEYTIKSIK